MTTKKEPGTTDIVISMRDITLGNLTTLKKRIDSVLKSPSFSKGINRIKRTFPSAASRDCWIESIYIWDNEDGSIGVSATIVCD